MFCFVSGPVIYVAMSGYSQDLRADTCKKLEWLPASNSITESLGGVIFYWLKYVTYYLVKSHVPVMCYSIC